MKRAEPYRKPAKDETAPKSFWRRQGGRAWSGIKRGATATAGAFQRALFGDKETRRIEILQRLSAMPEGKELLEVAAENDIGLRITGWNPLSGIAGYVGRDEGAAESHVGVMNDGKVPAMVMTLFHELRHVAQQADNGTLKDAEYDTLMPGTKGYIEMLLTEADAFTAEILQAKRLEKRGQPEYFSALRQRGGGVMREAEKFLRRQPYEIFHDDAEFSRALFTHLMLDGLNSYAGLYLHQIEKDFRQAHTLEEFKKLAKEITAPPPYESMGEILGAQYGKDYAAGVSMTGIATVFMHTRPDAEQRLMRDIDKVVKQAVADVMTTEGFARACAKIEAGLSGVMEQLPELSDWQEYEEDFGAEKIYSDKTKALRQTVRIASHGTKPMLRDSFRKAAADRRAGEKRRGTTAGKRMKNKNKGPDAAP
ncbi:MAG: hypothetical protein GC185_03735 [Alphaproteobacteria bacterium]|nr:hypothetical protein [Alphaproteobacteria bacterium]